MIVELIGPDADSNLPQTVTTNINCCWSTRYGRYRPPVCRAGCFRNRGVDCADPAWKKDALRAGYALPLG